MITLKADDRSRVKLPDIQPGQVFAYEKVGNTVKLTPVKPVEEDIPVVKPIRRADGTYYFPDHAKLTREDIRSYLRAERDSQ